MPIPREELEKLSTEELQQLKQRISPSTGQRILGGVSGVLQGIPRVMGVETKTQTSDLAEKMFMEQYKNQLGQQDPLKQAKIEALGKFNAPAEPTQGVDEDLFRDIPEEDRKYYRVKKTYQNIDGIPVVVDKEIEETSEGKRFFKQREKDKGEREKKETYAQSVKDSANDTLNTIQKIKEGINYFGARSYLPKVAGTPRQAWGNYLNKFLSGMVIDVMTKMKEASKTGATGFGQLSEKELKVLQEASTALKETLAPQDALEILNTMEEQLKKVAITGKKIPTSKDVSEFSITDDFSQMTDEELRKIASGG